VSTGFADGIGTCGIGRCAIVMRVVDADAFMTPSPWPVESMAAEAPSWPEKRGRLSR
jgi:hypothetical protein